jgi:hypothetical protein
VTVTGEDNGNGGAGFVTHSEFNKYCEQNDRDHRHISNAMWGTEGTNGMIKDIHDLKMWIKFMGIVGAIFAGIISPLITAYIIKIFGGGI